MQVRDPQDRVRRGLPVCGNAESPPSLHDMYASVASRFPEAECHRRSRQRLPRGLRLPAGGSLRRLGEQYFGEPPPGGRLPELREHRCRSLCARARGGSAWRHGVAAAVLGLLARDSALPHVVTTLHTVLREPKRRPAAGARWNCASPVRVSRLLDRTRGRSCEEIYDVLESKIDLIAGCIPDTPLRRSEPVQGAVRGRGAAGAASRSAVSVAEQGHRAHAPGSAGGSQIVPHPVYIVLRRDALRQLAGEQGQRYRLGLSRLHVKLLGTGKYVGLGNRFVELMELTEFIRGAELYRTPYLNPSADNLGHAGFHAFGCGKAVVSTPYWHAEELLADGRGVRVPFADLDQRSSGD